MRLKPFLVFIFIFTIFYILFFVLFDRHSLKKLEKAHEKKVLSLLDEAKYTFFANFYGLTRTLSTEVLKNIYQEVHSLKSISIEVFSSRYQITPYEFVVAILYFEYFHLMDKKTVSLEENLMIPMSLNDQSILYRYQSYFSNQCDYSTIVSEMGNMAVKDMEYINHKFLVPGIRILDSKIYYVGGYDENA